jgi:hypothetical protein
MKSVTYRAPRPKKEKRKESSIQDAIRRWVDKRWPRDPKTGVTRLEMHKFSQGLARFPTGDPDWIFMPFTVPFKRVWLMELKATGKKPTELQAAKIKRWRAMGYHVYVVDDVEKAKEIILAEMSEVE